MFKLIVIAGLMFLGYKLITPEAPKALSDEEGSTTVAESEKPDKPKAASRIEEYKNIGKKVTKNTREFEAKLNQFNSQFRSINSRKDHSTLYSTFSSAVSSFYRNTFNYRTYPNMTEKEQAMLKKLKEHMNKSASVIDKKVHDVHVVSCAAKSRAYNRECGKRA